MGASMPKKSLSPNLNLSYNPNTLSIDELKQLIHNIEPPISNGMVRANPAKASAVLSLVAGILAAKLAEQQPEPAQLNQ